MKFLYSLLVLATAGWLSACSNYGEKVTKEYLEVYYQPSVSKQVAEKTLDFLYPIWRLQGDATEKKSVQLDMAGDTLLFRMVSKTDMIDDMGDAAFIGLAKILSDSIFDQKPVNVVLTDNTFKTVKTIRHQVIDWGEKVVFGEIEVYMGDNVSKQLTQQLASQIDFYFGRNGKTKTFQHLQESDGLPIVKMVVDKEVAKEIPRSEFQKMVDMLSKDVFSGAVIQFELTDTLFEPLDVFKSSSQE